MRVLLLNTNNSAGGATKACVRLHKSLLKAGVASDLLMLEQPAGDMPRGHSFYAFHQQQRQQQYARQSLPRKLIGKAAYHLQLNEDSYYDRLNAFQRKLLSQKKDSLEVFTFSQSPYRIQQHPLYQQADIIHLHWVSDGFLDYEHFFPAGQKPVVWTLHDTNPFTGGCHYTEGCQAFVNDCAGCPQLAGSDHSDYASKSLARKVVALQNNPNVTIVSPSRWLLEESKKSRAFRDLPHRHIPNGIDSRIFQPRDRSYSRQLLGIANDKPIILFAAYSVASKRKGYHLLLEALERLNLRDKITLCAIGSRGGRHADDGIVELGHFSDDRLMSIAYSAADAFVIPSLEDNLPNVVIESLLCGTPVIGFPVGGIVDMVQDGVNGLLCRDATTAGLVEQLERFTRGNVAFDRNQIRTKAVEAYDSFVQVRSYLALYGQLLGKPELKATL
jgi:glycosyltransferase involved in cell wall biosynthesis